MEDRAGELTLILEECLDAIQQKGWSVEDCLAHYPDYRRELEPLLRLSAALSLGRSLRARESFRRESTRRLQSRIKHGRQKSRTVRQSQAPRLPLRRMTFALGTLAVVIALSLGSAGTIYAANGSVPGDPLYGLDLVAEQVQLDLSTGSNLSNLQLQFADERLKEAETLIERGDTVHADEALTRYNSLVDEISNSINGQAGDAARLTKIDEVLAKHQQRLTEMLQTVPEPAKAGISRALDASSKGHDKAQDAIEKSTGKPENAPSDNAKPTPPAGNGKGAGTPGQGQGNGKGQGKGSGSGPGKGNSGGSGDQGQGEASASCPDGTDLPPGITVAAEKLAEKYSIPLPDVYALFCSGMSEQEVEDQLKGD